MSDIRKTRMSFEGEKRAPRASLWGRRIAALLLLCQPAGAAPLRAADASLSRFKNVSYEDRCVTIHLDREAPYRVFSLSKPPRLVVEISRTVHAEQPYESVVKDGVVNRIRSAQFQTSPEKVTRLVLDMPKLLPYKASQQGKDIMLRFEAVSTEAARTEAEELPAVDAGPAHKRAPVLAGEMEESVTATAQGQGLPSSRKTGGRSKDLLSGLPRNPITIDFDNADIRDVMRVLSEMSGINIIYASDINGFVTIHLDQVPFNEAFSTILTMQGLVSQQMGDNVLRILTPEALNADRGRSVTIYRTFTLNYAKASEVAVHLASIRISPNGKITIDERNNALVVIDTPEGLSAAERLISELDKKPQQVMIEARMVEIQLNSGLDLGIQWEYSNLNRNAKNTQVLGIRETKAGTSVDAGSVGFLGTRANPTSGATEEAVSRSVGPGGRGTGVNLPGPTASAITFGFINNTDLLTATLGALASQGKTKILSSPKVITINNQTAKIQVGSKIPFPITTVTGTGVATQSVQFVDVGILLTVTPTINADSRVRLSVKPEVSFAGAITPGIGPEINTRNAETEVLIRDGETLVIGGLIDEQTRESASKVPLMGDIPVLGTFFRSTHSDKRRNELLVFVTPRIVRD